MAQFHQSWYIAVVADVADPDKRRRLRLRGPDENEDAVPTDKLPWINAFNTSKDDFQLPAVDEKVMVFMFGKLKLWTELPDYESWSEFSEDDYATAFMEKHKDKFSRQFTESEGWKTLYVGNIELTTDLTHTTHADKAIESEITADSTKITQNQVELSTDGKSLKLTVNQVTIETDGTKIKLANATGDLLSCIESLIDVFKQHTHQTPAGPSSPLSIDLPQVEIVSQKFSSLLKK